jgi:hypothetical protein
MKTRENFGQDHKKWQRWWKRNKKKFLGANLNPNPLMPWLAEQDSQKKASRRVV